ncbi:MAG: patatin-like phospholipase family protein [Streptomyces sp.]|nr:patatin-like phospholipase family protein [Streptomyces sp.]
MSAAFVLSGGGSLGAVQAGMLYALAEHGIMPDLLVGTSAGAVNAAYFAGRPDLAGALHLASVWRELRRSDIFPFQPATALAALTGHRAHLVDNTGLRRLLERHLAYSDLCQAVCPVRVVATDVRSGREAVLGTGPAVEAVLASSAVPGVLPAVPWQGQELLDGAVANNTPVSVAVQEGATTVYVLHAGYACALRSSPSSALGRALQALSVIQQQRLVTGLAALHGAARLLVVPPLCPLAVSPADFGHACELIDRSQESTSRWLAEGTPPVAFDLLRLHTHA